MGPAYLYWSAYSRASRCAISARSASIVRCGVSPLPRAAADSACSRGRAPLAAAEAAGGDAAAASSEKNDGELSSAAAVSVSGASDRMSTANCMSTRGDAPCMPAAAQPSTLVQVTCAVLARQASAAVDAGIGRIRTRGPTRHSDMLPSNGVGKHVLHLRQVPHL